MKAEHNGSVDVKTLTSVARAELFRSSLGCQLWAQATSWDTYLTLEAGDCQQTTSFGFCNLTGSGGRILESLGV